MGLGAAGLAAVLGPPGWAAGTAPRRLRLYNKHTRESFDDAYFAEGGYLPEAHQALNRFLRDHHADVAGEMDPSVFDLLWRLGARYRRAQGHDVVINIHSAFRTEETNAKLRAEGAAWNSQHKAGRAVDVSVQGYGIYFLGHHALNLGDGGVGIYWRAGFVHLDTGSTRRWHKRF